MGYTNNYEDLLRDIQESGQYWSDYDLELARNNPDAGRSIYTYKQQYYNATTDEERLAANQGAEAIRSRYGNYSGGGDGSGYILSDKYAPQYTQYTSQYKDQIDSLLHQLMNREAFSYNPAADPSYQAYSEKYRNLGNKAMQNALGSAAAMTGGQLNSYAMTAAQQAQNDYNAQLSNVIPELQQLAYNMYVGEGNAMRANLSNLMDLDQMAYGRHMDTWNANMDVWQNNYNVDADQYERDRYEREQQYEQDRYLAELMAGAGDYGRYSGMGLTDDERAKLENAYQESVRSASRTGGKDLTFAQAKALLDEGIYSDAALAVYEAYVGEPYKVKGNAKGLDRYLSNPAVQTAKNNIDFGRWTGETLLQAIEAAVGKTITEEEAEAILDYAGL